MAESIGYDSQTRLRVFILYFTFLASFFNSAVIPIISNFDFRYWYILRNIETDGAYTDFVASWYTNVGSSLIISMCFMVVRPLTSFGTSISIRYFKIIMDSGFPCCPRMKTVEKRDLNSNISRSSILEKSDPKTLAIGDETITFDLPDTKC